ncbi:MAG: tRNA (adenosine(37)-N6)-dimethylallyltransferase MiaA [Candidatus Eisenbacteria bacterium]|uniref:tRNA dimethylallyltransferase n=1 Tax=Eiseniibacteriota bacterium TaxID=2212470 RepID=A0A9D6QJC7_UNCEI|nr:tRNA (adenosine(37)-N6)-dimethylallyltransferase MiaA [Candidatus Eisenbacteria bacterium]MBI3539105.1 tRNA (adenosine(37)-N6)-dimethylallyltransferase MiaA [Candidatus Eisenbacteria bacterium]
MSARRRVIALVGATATGKTALGEALGARLGLEVVCADSRQVFAELEIGTGKPSPAERAARPHHLFAARRLDQPASAGWYARAAREALAVIAARGGRALLVGGSGLYLRALMRGLAPVPAPPPEIRERLRAALADEGAAALHARLAARDPATAARLAPRDGQRVTRALEVIESTGRPLSWWLAHPPAPAEGERWTVLEITATAALTRERIALRTRAMLADGLIEETRALLDAGMGERLVALRAVGYDEAMETIAGRIDTDEAARRIDVRTAQLAKRQRTWFRHQIEAERLDAVSARGDLLDRALAAIGA